MEKRHKKNSDNKALETTKRRFAVMKHGLYIQVNGIDGRTRLGKTISALRNQLRNFVGESTTGSELLIARIVYKSIRLGLYEAAKFADLEGGEADHYLPMSNSLRLDLVALATMAGKPKVPDLDEYIRANYGGEKK